MRRRLAGSTGCPNRCEQEASRSACINAEWSFFNCFLLRPGWGNQGYPRRDQEKRRRSAIQRRAAKERLDAHLLGQVAVLEVR